MTAVRKKLSERQVEAHLVATCKAHGIDARKFTSPGHRAVPDRILLIPGGKVAFVECKAPGKKATLPQLREHAKLRRLGFLVYVVDNLEWIDATIPVFLR